MNNKLIIIISTEQLEKARTGMMYAVNALEQSWMEDVKIIFFGPAQKLVNEDAELQQFLKRYQDENKNAVVCKFIADRDNIVTKAKELKMDVEYVGKIISNFIKEGYIPMVW